MSRLSTSIFKEFFLSAEWSQSQAERLDHFCEEVANNTVAVRTGSYTGNGVVQAVSVQDLPQTPILALIQPTAGGTPFLTLVPYASGAITTWTREGFTLLASGAYNTPGTLYNYLVLA